MLDPISLSSEITLVLNFIRHGGHRGPLDERSERILMEHVQVTRHALIVELLNHQTARDFLYECYRDIASSDLRASAIAFNTEANGWSRDTSETGDTDKEAILNAKLWASSRTQCKEIVPLFDKLNKRLAKDSSLSASDIGTKLIQTLFGLRLEDEYLLKAADKAGLSKNRTSVCGRFLQARDAVSSANQYLVRKVARRFRNRGLDKEDLLQQGSFGILTAIEKFDLSRKKRFAASAYTWILQSIQRYIRQSHLIPIPEPEERLAGNLAKSHRELSRSKGREPTEKELAKELGVDRKTIRDIARIKMLRNPRSLNDDSHHDPDNNEEFGASLVDDDAPYPYDEAVKQEIAHALRQTMRILKPMEERIVRLRFGIGCPQQGLQETAKATHRTVEKVQATERKALRKLARIQQLQFL